MKKLLVLIAAIALVSAFALPAAAGDWSFYGSSRMATFITTSDDTLVPPDGDSDMEWAQQGNSRIGGSTTSGDISGKFEYGTGVNLRVLWAEWNYGNGSLGLGQNYVPCNLWTSSQTYGGDAGLLDVGGLYGGRLDMIMLKTGAFKVAAIEPSTTTPAAGDTDTMLPKIEASWSTAFGPGSVQVVFGYNSINVEGTAAGDIAVNSYVVGVLGSANFGAGYVNANVVSASNYTNYGLPSWFDPGAGASGAAAIEDTDVKDASTLGFLVAAGFKASDTMKLELGVGQVTHTPGTTGADPDGTMAYYAQASIALADGFFIVPEIGGYNFGEDSAGADQGSMTYLGAKWQMNF